MLRNLIPLVLACGFVLGEAVPLQAQSEADSAETEPSQREELTTDFISRRLKLIEASSLADDEKAKVLKIYEDAATQIELADQLTRDAAGWKKLQADAPTELKRLQEKLAQPDSTTDLEIPSTAGISELDQLLSTTRQTLNEAKSKLEDLKKDPARRDDRRTAAADIRKSANDRIAKLEEALQTSPAPGTSPELAQATAILQRATQLAEKRKLEALDAELPAYHATTELLDLRQQLAAREVADLERQVATLSELLDQKRLAEALEQAKQALAAAEKTQPQLRPIAEENVRLAEMRIGSAGLVARIQQADQELQQSRKRVDRAHEIETEVTEKLKLPGMAAYSGDLLLQAKSQMPRMSDLERSMDLRRSNIAEVRFQLADVRNRKSQLDDTSDELASLAQSEDTSEAFIETGKELLATQRQLLQDLEADYTAYFDLLIDVNANEQELHNSTERVTELVAEHLMWVRARGVFGWQSLRNSLDSFAWFASPSNWRRVLADTWEVIWTRTFLCLSSLIVFAVLAVGRSRMQSRLRELGQQAARSVLVPFRITLQACWLTVLLTWLWPSLVFGIGWCLTYSPTAAEFTRAVGAGLMFAGVVYVALELTRRILGNNGLAEAHFRWTFARRSIARRNLYWLTLSLVPLAFAYGHIRFEGDLIRIDSLGRLVFIAGMLLLAVFLRRALQKLNAEAPPAATFERSLLVRISYAFAVALPLFVAGLSFLGFHFTAVQLSMRIFATACLGLGMLVLHGLAARWLWLVRGQLALQAARKNKTPPTELAQTEYSPHNDADKTVDEPIDLPMVNRQTRQLLKVFLAVSAVAGIWLIWLNVLPGYRDVLIHPIWSADGPFSAASIGDSVGLDVVTIADLLLAVLIVLIAFQLSRNIPGLIEVGSLRMASLDAGARYALSTIIRYILLAIAVGTAFSIVGIGWSKVQWLVAALSVGLGFGLQELVANFVSGVLLLFERPVRVGDIVTFDGVTGTVTRVQIRATTVRNWDQQDYLIPNKDLITGRVLNWTLSGQLNRVVIKVGVARNSDPRQVRAILLEILSEHEKVLEEPGPMVNFDGFGESTLDFAVIAYLGSFDGRVDLINEIRTQILERFREENIEIAVPQRDIRVRQMPSEDLSENPKLATQQDD